MAGFLTSQELYYAATALRAGPDARSGRLPIRRPADSKKYSARRYCVIDREHLTPAFSSLLMTF